MIRAWLVAFVFTQLVEVPLYSIGLRVRVVAAFGASAITHPIVWFVICNPRWGGSYWTQVAVAELFAWLAEAAYFALAFGINTRRALGWSLIANAASFSAGLLSRALIGAP
ncbi:MAG: hypothetical protein FWD69_04740 [Polyangiaceae bacterium]|nr:hypothetical protein [Polyangiaceae bacterium]